jgi:hypothetical protein
MGEESDAMVPKLGRVVAAFLSDKHRGFDYSCCDSWKLRVVIFIK